MASSGKKGKKVKGKTLALNEFLGDTPPLPPPPLRKHNFNWAEESEDVLPPPAMQMYLPTAPRAARGSEFDEARIPKNGPFVAYIFNLLYDIEESDIAEFFHDMNVVNIRLPKDDRSGKLKGFGYVEFGDRTNLLQALQLSETPIKGRRIRIEVADVNERDNRRGGMGRDRDRDRDRESNFDPERTMGDWRSGPRPETSSMDRGPRRDFGSREIDRDNFDRDGGSNWRDAPRRPLADDRDGPRNAFGPSKRYGRDVPRESSPPPEGRVRPKLDLKPRTLPLPMENLSLRDGESDGETSRVRDKGINESAKPPSSNPFGSAKPVDTSAREREIEEKIGKPATLPHRQQEREQEDSSSRLTKGDDKDNSSRPPKPSAASIFGGAKPVDTAQREREIEERLAKERESELPKPNIRDGSSERKEEKLDKAEPAPPPAENAWTKRAQSSRAELPRVVSPSREPRDSPPPRDRVDDSSRDRDRDRYPPRRDDRGRGTLRDSDRDYRRERDDDYNRRDRDADREYPRRDRDGDRDYSRREREGDRDYPRRDRDNDKDYSRRDREGDRDYSRRDRDDRDSTRRDRVDDRRRESERDSREGARDGERDRERRNDRSRDNHPNDKERAPVRDPKDRSERPPREPRPMPKASEASAPNYVAPNKYSFLEEDAPAE